MLKINIEKKINNKNINFFLKINFEIEMNENLFFFGSSGSGKTTLLNLLSGLIKPDRGKIEFENNIWFESNLSINSSPQSRKIGYLFQDLRLFPNMNVKENILYGMKNKSYLILYKLLKIIQMEEFIETDISKLSGGQKQRVALARAVAGNPKLLLLDEPFSALDFSLKNDLMNSLLKLKEEFNFSMIIVTHDLRDIFNLSGNVIYLEKGSIIRKEFIEKNEMNKLKNCSIKKKLYSI